MSKTTRRTFLKTSLAAGSLFAIGGCQSTPRILGANDRLRIAVAGVHGRGGSHINNWLGQDNVEVAYLIDPDERVLAGKLDYVKRKTEGKSTCQGVADVREALEDKNLDAISIATPNHWHSLMTIWAAQAGKHVYVEKPMSHDIAEGRVAVEAQKKYGVVIQHGTQSRSKARNAGLHDLIRSGKFGKMKISYGYCCKPRGGIGFESPSAPPANLDWNLWRGPAVIDQYHANYVHYDWHWFWETGNGDIGNSDVHRADLVRFGLGVTKLPRATMCYGGRFGYSDSAQTPNTQVAVHDFGDVTFVQEVRGLPTSKFHRHGGAIFAGSGGYVGMAAGSSAFFDRNGKLVEKFAGKNDEHFGNFIEAVHSRDRDHLNAEVLGGHLSAGLCHLGNISYRLGSQAAPREVLAQLAERKLFDDSEDTFERTRKHLADNGVDIEKTSLTAGPWLRFDADEEAFIGNAEADAMLTREYRNPFVVPNENEV